MAICNLIKIVFNVPLHKIPYTNPFSSGGVSPGGAIFRWKDIYKVDFRNKTIILQPGHKFVERFAKKNRGIIRIRSGENECVLSPALIKYADTVQADIPKKLLCPKRKTQMAFQARMPYETWWFIGSPFFKKMRANGSILDMKATHYNNISTIDFIIRRRYAKTFTKKFFEAKLTPPGREWMLLSHATSAKTLND